LTPITYSANKKHLDDIEDEVKKSVLYGAKGVVYYKVIAQYKGHKENEEDYELLKSDIKESNDDIEKNILNKQLETMENERELCTFFDYEFYKYGKNMNGTVNYNLKTNSKSGKIENIIPKKRPLFEYHKKHWKISGLSKEFLEKHNKIQ
jgi:hypothetical protein